ncbi:M23 family peptidase, partial [Kitasatospora sp. NPDC057965]
QGTNYVYCKAWGREVSSGGSFNHWWLKTDPDSGPSRQWVSAFYLSRWGNDTAKDNNGTTIPDC